MKSTLARVHNFLAWLLFAGSIIQFFLISLFVFKAAESSLHANGGRLLMLVALVMVIVSLIIRTNKWNVILSILVFLLLFPVQGLLAYGEFLPEPVRAMHAVSGMLILISAYAMANGFAKAEVPLQPDAQPGSAAEDSASTD